MATATAPPAPEAGSPEAASRHDVLDVARLRMPAALVFNPQAGQKLGIATNAGGADATQDALRAAGVPFEPWPTERAGHATELARQAVDEGRQLVIAAGGDGTVAEVAHGLAGTDLTLGIMPLGSVMNVARTLCIPRDLGQAAAVIRQGQVLRMDMGRANGRYFLEAAGIGLDAGLFAYFNRVDKGRMDPLPAARGALRFMRSLGTPRLIVEGNGRHYEVRAPMVAVANSKYVGAAYAIAPDARIDDGLLDVVVFRGAGIPRILLHLLLIAGGRRLPPPASAYTLRVQSVRVAARRTRQLPFHADGEVGGTTPAQFEAVPAALRVLVGTPDPDTACSWEPPRTPVPMPTPDGTAV